MGTASEELVLEDMKNSSGEQYKYFDRRQEIVFIGQNMKYQVIQKLLDQCLLNDEEIDLGPEKWKEIMADADKIQLVLREHGSERIVVTLHDAEEEEENEGEEDFSAL